MEAMKIFALSPPKEDLAELAEAIAIGLGGSQGSFLCGGGGTKYQFNVPTLGRKKKEDISVKIDK